MTEKRITVNRSRLGDAAWQLESDTTLQLFRRIAEGTAKSLRTTLTEFVGSKPSYGVKTGLNDAFFIDSKRREQIIAADPASSEIIKPLIRGRDITRWTTDWDGVWLIFTRRGIDITNYPGILAHLEAYRKKLEPKPTDWVGGTWAGRKGGSYQWYEIQDSVDYWEEFEKPKIFYQEIQTHPWYGLDLKGSFGNNKTFYILSQDLYLLGILNSPLMWWHNFRYLPHMINEALTPQGIKMESLPIAIPEDTVRREIEKAVTGLIAITSSAQILRRELLDWLKVEFEVVKPSTKLQDPISLTSDSFVAETKKGRGSKKSLTSASLKRLREEYTETIEPAQKFADEAKVLERRIHDLVNEAYGLSAEEVRLLWDTAPPRMPIDRPPGV